MEKNKKKTGQRESLDRRHNMQRVAVDRRAARAVGRRQADVLAARIHISLLMLIAAILSTMGAFCAMNYWNLGL